MTTMKLFDAASEAGRAALEARLAARGVPDFDALAAATPIVRDVLARGEPAVREYRERFDGVGAGAADAADAEDTLVQPLPPLPPPVDPAFAQAFRLAAARVAAYHARQLPKGFSFRDGAGFSFREAPVPHERVGVYVPGGRAFYPSSLLMGCVPARVAGVSEIVVATPPAAWRESRELRWAASELGVSRVVLAGGAHGVAALVKLAGCTKVVGPGNRWVAAAKHLLSSVVSVDLPAGPSEVLIVASVGSPPELVAADLLAQAEHDPDAVCLLFADSKRLAERVLAEVERRLPSLATAETARRALDGHGAAFVFASVGEAAAAGARVAAEHVQLFGREAESFRDVLARTSGAVFVGRATPTALGDYVAGPNHVLPTGGAARSFSGLSVREFFRWGRSVSAPRRGAAEVLAAAATLARFEGLDAHVRSLELRA